MAQGQKTLIADSELTWYVVSVKSVVSVPVLMVEAAGGIVVRKCLCVDAVSAYGLADDAQTSLVHYITRQPLTQLDWAFVQRRTPLE